MGFGLEEDAIHSPNENFRVENFLKGIESIIHFYLNFQKKKLLVLLFKKCINFISQTQRL